jgi:uroporphyrin-III C-methyltransferase/precorrin-2 dehydrogenase/sirohydrochlorin ferrochelatase
MDHLPIWLTAAGLNVLVVGGKDRAARKVRLALKTGARVTVVAPEVGGEIDSLANAGKVVRIARRFQVNDLDGVGLVYAATGLDAVDEAVSAEARACDILVNVTDRADLSTFIMPAIVDRSPVVIGIASGGTAPLLVRELRSRFEAMLPSNLGRLARFAGKFRSAVRATINDASARRRFWEGFFNGPLAKTVLEDESKARERMLSLVNRRSEAAPAEGIVHIVGTGPGNPDLLTLRALQVMQSADVILHDRLIGPEILDYARRDAERLYVGKTRGDHSWNQERINAVMAERAQAGQRVVRLKGGDPFIFGRGGEEAAYLKAKGVAVEVVPGITAASGCAAGAGIPLTHRDFASAVTFVTAQAKSGEPDLDWKSLANLGHTLVVYMGVNAAAAIAARLTEAGLAASTPAAVVENGTLPEQRVIMGTLGGLGTLVADHGVRSPALLVIGGVVTQADVATLGALAKAAAS